MPHAYIENNEVVEVQFLLPKSWRNISNFDSLTTEDLNNLGWFEIIDEIPEYDPETMELYDTVLVIGDRMVKRVFLARAKESVTEPVSVVTEPVSETPPV